MFEILLSILPNEASWKGAILWWIVGTLLVGGCALFFIWLFTLPGEINYTLPE